jgi:hypothetical protein
MKPEVFVDLAPFLPVARWGTTALSHAVILHMHEGGLSCLLIFISGAAIMASASLMLSLVQLIVADQMRGRVMSVYNLDFRAGIPLGSLALGKLIPLVGVSIAVAGDGLLLVAVTVFFLFAQGSVIFRAHTASQGIEASAD